MLRFAVAIAAALATVLASPCSAAGNDKPAVVCESDASGQAMRCREAWPGEDAAPFRRVAPAAAAPTGAAPKPAQPLLAAPAMRSAPTRSAPEYLRGNPHHAAAATMATPTLAGMTRPATPEKADSTLAAAKPGTITEAAISTVPDATSVRVTDTVAAEATPRTTTAAPARTASVESAASLAATQPAPVQSTPAPASAAATQPVPAPAAVAGAETAAPVVAPLASATPIASEGERAAAAEPPTPPPPSAPLLGPREFAALDGSRYTLELANARAPAPLRELAARLALDGAVYLVHLRNPDADRWLLAWSDHASQADARTARQQVPADPAINSGWPRRLAPLQNELVFP